MVNKTMSNLQKVTRVSNLKEATTISNSDVLLVETATETLKVTKENLLKEINQQLNTKSDLSHTHSEYMTESSLNNKGLATETFVTNKITQEIEKTNAQLSADKQELQNQLLNETNKITQEIEKTNAQLSDVAIKTKGTINVYEYGYIGDGKSHKLSESYTSLAAARQHYPQARSLEDEKDWCALQQAIIDCATSISVMNGKGATIKIPHSKGIFNRQLQTFNVGLLGDSLGTELSFDIQNLTSETAAIVIRYKNDAEVAATGRTQQVPTFENLLITGNSGLIGLGEKGTLLNGIELIGEGRCHFVNCIVKHFYKGNVWNNDVGWIMYDRCTIKENYYNIYVQKNNGDYRINHTTLSYARFANFAVRSSAGVQGLVMRGGHCGFAPYGFYCEPELSNSVDGNQNRNQFMKDVHLDHVRFEGIGNGAITSDYSQGSNPLFAGVKILNPGFMWLDEYKLKDRPREDYCIDIGEINGADVFIDNGAWKFTPGLKNTVRIRSLKNVFSMNQYETKSVIDVLSGTGQVVVGSGNLLSSIDGSISPTYISGAFCEVIKNGEKAVFKPYFKSNASGRYKASIICDATEAFGVFFHEGSVLQPMSIIGSNIAFGNTEISEHGKINIYRSDFGEITIKNLFGSDRKVSISVEAFI
jgi:phosphorylcholine metabolism protein LicD